MMKREKKFSSVPRNCACLLTLLLAGCAGVGTRPVSVPQNKTTQLASDTFRIEYRARSMNSRLSAEDAVMFRAAQVTSDHNMNYFAIVAIGDDSVSGEPATQGSKAIPGSVYGLFGVGSGSASQSAAAGRIAYARKSVTIRCFQAPPADLVSSSAMLVEQDIKKKYGVQ